MLTVRVTLSSQHVVNLDVILFPHDRMLAEQFVGLLIRI